MITINQVQVNDKVDLFAIIKKSEDKRTLNGQGKNYIDFVFEDLTGSIEAKMWDSSLEMIGGHGDFSPGIAVKVRGTISEWQNKKQMKVEQIRLLLPEDGITKNDLIKSAPLSPEEMIEYITTVIETYSNEDLKKVSHAIILKHKEKLLYYPASMKVHHDIKSGLLYHTYCMLNIAIKLSEIYPMNKDLLFTGCIIHDLGKIDELDSNEDGVCVDYTKEGKLLGHMITGIKMIHDLSKDLDLDPNVTVLLEHMIASHHDRAEFGAVKPPMFYEAELLHFIDMIDARSFMYKNIHDSVEPNTFSDRMFFLNNKQIFNHKL